MVISKSVMDVGHAMLRRRKVAGSPLLNNISKCTYVLKE